MPNSHINLIKIDFQTPLFLADHGHDVTFNGDIYRADSRLLLEIGDVTEENTLNTTTFDVTLAAVPELVILLRSGEWLNVSITYFSVYLENGAVIDSEVVFKGRLLEVSETDSLSGSTVQFSCSSHFIDWESKGGRMTNQAVQQLWDSSDRGLEHAGKEKSNIKWGKA